ncbi:hypothetical protein BKA67DRAFT_147457 [Truncatella angustata]|uniref:Uncharacterized protein n=1 Tax=Truncatella angustata TaxID=152316 RepID=A0A9P8REC4_9PEZI|nr:uncharacterized protein BKA67DRAFT_147457 [Truncatella angustata]KAH6638705.1 hypothetical protein BKA67DRAFT_147457 [Truncatella angustata]
MIYTPSNFIISASTFTGMENRATWLDEGVSVDCLVKFLDLSRDGPFRQIPFLAYLISATRCARIKQASISASGWHQTRISMLLFGASPRTLSNSELCLDVVMPCLVESLPCSSWYELPQGKKKAVVKLFVRTGSEARLLSACLASEGGYEQTHRFVVGDKAGHAFASNTATFPWRKSKIKSYRRLVKYSMKTWLGMKKTIEIPATSKTDFIAAIATTHPLWIPCNVQLPFVSLHLSVYTKLSPCFLRLHSWTEGACWTSMFRSSLPRRGCL